MSDDMIRPNVVTAHRNGYYTIRGLDASTPAGERLALDFDRAPCAEDLVEVVYEAVEAGVAMYTTADRWIKFNPALVVTVECRSFDG